MSLSKKMQNAINKQIQLELSSAYVYLGMSAWCESAGWGGFGSWLQHQWEEEIEHAKRLINHMHDRGGDVVLQAIAKPPADYKSLLEVFKKALKHEQVVTKSIHSLYDAAQKEKDFATMTHLNWFITEQVEEEKTTGDIVDKLKIVGTNQAALLQLDDQMAARSAAGHEHDHAH
jgi:ferritin